MSIDAGAESHEYDGGHQSESMRGMGKASFEGGLNKRYITTWNEL